MTIIRSGALALLLSAVAAVPAQATVTYALAGSFVAAPGIDPIEQHFVFTVDQPLTQTQLIPLSAFSQCDAGPGLQCVTGAFFQAGDLPDPPIPAALATLTFTADDPATSDFPDLLSFYNFTPAAFTANGMAGDNAGLATLTVSGVPAPPSVPEAAAWAMMVAGFGAIGAALRRRTRTARVRFG